MNRELFLKYTCGRGFQIDTYDGGMYLGVDYDNETDTMFSGYISNVGVSRNAEMQYDDDLSIEENLCNLYNEVLDVFRDEINDVED